MPSVPLTQTFVDKNDHQLYGKSKIDYFDERQSGLLLKVLQSGKKTFYLRYVNDRNKQVEKKLADADILKLSEVRQLAQEKLALIAIGQDPFAAKKALKDVPTFADFVAESYLPYVKGYKRSWDTDVSLLKNHILIVIGDLYLDEITRRHMVDLFSKHRESHKPSSTNRVIILCRYIFNCAIKWETAGIVNNPTKNIDLFPENNKLERYITSEESRKLFEQLEVSENKDLKYIVGMLLLTGARKREVLDAKWSDFDFTKRIWTIQFNKSGKARHVPISDGVITLLQQVEKKQVCEWLFPNPKTMKPYVTIFVAWNTARTRAGLPDVRIHDLRHSFASFLINSGRSLYEVQKILGHTQVKTTQRYAHLSQDSLVSAANCASGMVSLVDVLPNDAEEMTLIEAK